MNEEHPSKVLRQLEQRARRRFGQHFLYRPDIVERIVRAAEVQPGDRVVEIGPGLGILTRALRAREASVTAVEIDRDLAEWIRATLPTVTLVEADALAVDWAELCPGSGWKLVSNLPYNVGTTLLVNLVQLPGIFESATVMLQREVVDRLVAIPGTKAFGALSLQVQARAALRYVTSVPPSAFHPPPKVDSAVVHLRLHPEPQGGPAGIAAFDRVVRASFAQRRKTIANSLGALYGKARAEEALVQAGIDPRERAERLGADAFRALAVALSAGEAPRTG